MSVCRLCSGSRPANRPRGGKSGAGRALPQTQRAGRHPRCSRHLPSLLVVLLSHAGAAWCQPAPHPAPAEGPALKGKIVDDQGQPLPGVKVVLWGGIATRWKVGEATTDAQGGYRFAQVKSSAIFDAEHQRWDTLVGITLEHPTHVSADGQTWWDERIPGTAGQEYTRDFKMARGGFVAGRVVVWKTGAPRAGFALRIVRGRVHPAYVTTDAQGRFLSPALAEGAYLLEINENRYPCVTVARATVQPGRTARVTIRLGNAVRLEIRSFLLAPDALGTDVLMKRMEQRQRGVLTGDAVESLEAGLKQLEERGFAHADSPPAAIVLPEVTGRVGTSEEPAEKPAMAYWAAVTPRVEGDEVDADLRVFIGTKEGSTASGRLLEQHVTARFGEKAALWLTATKEAPGDLVLIVSFTQVPLPEGNAGGTLP